MKLRSTYIMLSVLLAVAASAFGQDDLFPDVEDTPPPPPTTRRTTTTKRPTTTTRKPTTTSNTAADNVDERDLIGASQPDYCGLPFVRGLCKALVPKYYYFPNDGDCHMDSWGGCGGNANKFDDYITCMSTCGGGNRVFASVPTEPPSTTPAGLAARCYLPSDAGSGVSEITRYFFNPRVPGCQAFTWRGQGGNDNNFATPSQCNTVCAMKQTTTTAAPSTGLAGCTACSIGRCEDTAPNSQFNMSSSLLNIFLGLQSTCKGAVDRVRFIDNAPRAGKSFYLTIWDIKSSSSANPIYPSSSALPADLSQVSVRLINVGKVTTNGQSGWQIFNFTQPMDIDVGHYIGIHLESWQTSAADSVVAYTTTFAMPTITALADQGSIYKEATRLPKDVPLLAGAYQFSIDMRRPALIVGVKQSSGSSNLLSLN